MTAADFLVMRETGMKWCPTNTMSPEELSYGSRTRVWWNCEAGHRWRAAVYSVTEGSGCPYCAGKLASPGETDLATVRPDMLEEWDYELNDMSPTVILPSTHEKVWWKCGLGHSWQAAVFSRTREKGSGCPYCTGRKVLAGFNDLGTLQPKVAEQWHPTLNGELRPEDVTLGSNKKVWWRCRDGHVWQAAVFSRTRKKPAGCPVCAGTVRKRRKTAENPRRAGQNAVWV